MNVVECLRDVLERKGVKQIAVAKGIGMKTTTFNAIMKGHSALRADTLVEICRFLEMPPAKFFNCIFQENEKIGVEPDAKKEWTC